MGWKKLEAMDFAGKVALVRVDINVPVEDGRVTDTTRIDAVLPTIRYIADAGGKVVLLAHFGRPKGKPLPEMSLAPVRPALADRLGAPVAFAADCIGPAAEEAVAALEPGCVLLLENTRFHPGEEANDPDFAAALAGLGDVYVNDAFSTAHRAHASTEAIAHRLPACAGRLMEAELKALDAALGVPERPVVAVVGGAKVSTKIDLLLNLVRKAEHLVIGGAMANTFLAAQGVPVGRSRCEHEMGPTVREILARAEEAACTLHLPRDFRIASELAPGVEVRIARDCPPDWMILDAGPESADAVRAVLDTCRTLVWNGPLGAFEVAPFDTATNDAAQHAAALTKAGRLVTVAGGGDTVAALNRASVADAFTYVSTAGGAFLEWMEGKTLPGVAALER